MVQVKIGDKFVGDGCPSYIVGEIGINHNGDLGIARRLIDVASVAEGAAMIERHITLDRAMWGSDQAANVEPRGLMKLVRDTRTFEASLGDGVKKVTDDEIPIMKKLRRVG
jgi:sialic acid synthase SpsE